MTTPVETDSAALVFALAPTMTCEDAVKVVYTKTPRMARDEVLAARADRNVCRQARHLVSADNSVSENDGDDGADVETQYVRIHALHTDATTLYTDASWS